MKNKSFYGTLCGMPAGFCWGVSGVFGQFLFQSQEIDTFWLVPIRLLSAGVMMMTFLFLKDAENMKAILRNKRDLFQVALTGVFGTMMFQLTFFGAVQSSNAGTATVLQYLAPLIIVI